MNGRAWRFRNKGNFVVPHAVETFVEVTDAPR